MVVCGTKHRTPTDVCSILLRILCRLPRLSLALLTPRVTSLFSPLSSGTLHETESAFIAVLLLTNVIAVAVNPESAIGQKGY